MSSDVKSKSDAQPEVDETQWRTELGPKGDLIILKRGKMTDLFGNDYEGEFKDGIFHGYGTLRKRNGDTYTGMYRH